MSLSPSLYMPSDTPAERKARDAAYDKWAAEKSARIAAQRAVLAQSRSPYVKALVKAMLERAWALLVGDEAEAADALLEFVAAEQAEQLLREFFDD